MAILTPAHKATTGALVADAAVLTKRLRALGQSSDTASVRDAEVVVTGTRLKIPDAALARQGFLYFRPVLCGAPRYQPPTKGNSTPSGQLPSCGPFATTAANLAVNINSGGPSDNIPADPAFGPYRSTRNDNPKKTVLLGADPAAGEQQYARFVLAKASLGATSVASASAHFDTLVHQWAVNYTLTPSGARAWDQVAKANFHRYVAIDLDGAVESAPLIQPNQVVFTSFGGRGEISGDFSAERARTVAALLASGPLVAPLVVREP